MLDFDSLWDELYLNITIEDCDAVIDEVHKIQANADKLIVYLTELRKSLEEVRDSHDSQMGGDSPQQRLGAEEA